MVTQKTTFDPSEKAYAGMLREQGVWAKGCSVLTCGATTGHTVAPLAFCADEPTARIIAAALAEQSGL